MSITTYGKMVFIGMDGKMKVVQPKSYTDASKSEQTEITKLLFEGKYVLTQVAMPISTKGLK